VSAFSAALRAPDAPWRRVYGIAWPSIVELMFISMLGMADQLMVSRLSAAAVSAVGITSQPMLISFVLFQAFNVGGTALASRFIGSKDYKSAKSVTSQMMLLSMVFGVIVGVLEYIFARDLVLFMGATPDYLEDAVVYMRFAAVGVVLSSLPSAVTAALRAIGETKLPMRYNGLSNIVSILLNFLLIYGVGPFPRMGVAGAALATQIGKLCACVMSLNIIFKNTELPVSITPRSLFKPDWSVIKRIARVGLPTMGEQITMRVALLMFTKMLVGLGTITFAAHNIAISIIGLSFNVSQAFGFAATSLVGQSLGAQAPDQAERYVRTARRMGLMVSLSLSLSFFFLGFLIARPFMSVERLPVISAMSGIAYAMARSSNPILMSYLIMMLRVMAFIIPGQTSNLILAGALRGAGDTMWPLIATMIGMFIMRVGLALIFLNVLGLGAFGAWLAFLLDQYSRALVTLLRFNTGKWKLTKV